MTRKQIRKNRWWKHILGHLPQQIFGTDLRRLENYDPEKWRGAFEDFQSNGLGNLSPEEREGIHPLIQAQRQKEILLTELATECMEYWANGWGWMIPIRSTLDGEPKLDRLTKVAILRMMKTMEENYPVGVVDFFCRHPGIKESQRQRYLAVFLAASAKATKQLSACATPR